MTTDQDAGRVAVITGASSGIGEATARALAVHGFRVALLARRADRIQALAAELGDRAITIEADVTDRDSIVAAAERVKSDFGSADILVNNAGVMLLAPFTSDQRAEHRQMVEVNLLGAMTATELFLDQLRDGGGDLISISSVAGRTARAGNAVYAATKWGMNGWSEALRQELQPDIRVTVIEPYDLSMPVNQRKLDAADALAQLADEAGMPLIEMAIAFVIRHPAVTAAIIGPRTMEQLESQLPAAEVQLSREVLDRIDEIVAPGTNVNPADGGWVSPFLEPAARRR